MMGTKATGIAAAVCLMVNAAHGGAFTIGGFTFDEDNAVKTAKTVEGALGIEDHTSKVFARAGGGDGKTASATIDEFLTFNRTKSIGRLLGRTGRRSSDHARFVTFPERGKGRSQPNSDRATLELTWDGMGLPNKAGYDFVVYETGTYEGFSVSVRKAGSAEFSPPRYRFAEPYDTAQNVNPVAFDISSFGIPDGEKIDAIRIRNIFNSESEHGPDKVDDPSGEGRVLYPGDAGYETGHKLLAKVSGDEFRTEFLDADIIYVVGLHAIVKLESK